MLRSSGRASKGHGLSSRRRFTLLFIFLFLVIAAISFLEQGDHWDEVLEQEVQWISQNAFHQEEDEHVADEELQRRAAENFLDDRDKIEESVIKVAPKKNANAVSRLDEKTARNRKRRTSRQASTLSRPTRENRHRDGEDKFYLTGHASGESTKQAPKTTEPEPEPAAEKAEELAFDSEQIATIVDGLEYRLDNVTIHKLFASQSTIGETHSGPSRKGPVKVNLSDTQKELIPEDGAPSKRYKTCALVGNARSLLKKSHGKEIDGHDAVMRLNQATTLSFEKHVGQKTTFRLINSKWASAYTTSNKLQLERNVTLVVSRTDYRAFLRIASKLKHKRPDVSSMLLSRQAVNEAGAVLRELKRRMESIRGKRYPGKGSPSSGWVGTYFLLQMCDRLDIYGVGTTAFKEKVPNWHYFENHRFHSSREFGSDPHHSFALEHEILRVFDKENIVYHHA